MPGPFYRSLAPFRLWTALPRPHDWRADFGREAPLDVEIGIGNGDYFVRACRATPERDHLGIELEWDRTQKTLRKLARIGGTNARVLQADARIVLTRLLPSRSVATLLALFPCPWPRPRHTRHRLFDAGFLRAANDRLVDGGTLRIVSDAAPYLAWVAGQVPEGFDIARAPVAAGFGTWFETKWLAEGKTFGEITLVKRRHVPCAPEEDHPVQGHRVPACDPARLPPPEVRGPITVAWKEVVHDPARRLAMVRATVVEERLVQHLWFVCAGAADGWHLRPAEGCPFVPTRGVQVALDALRDACRA